MNSFQASRIWSIMLSVLPPSMDGRGRANVVQIGRTPVHRDRPGVVYAGGAAPTSAGIARRWLRPPNNASSQNVNRTSDATAPCQNLLE